jgi:hypothetical protein
VGSAAEPDDWKLDPEFAKKWENDKMARMKGGIGYHDEANGPTSAALARYDNPRAQKMYKIVRRFMDSTVYGSSPNRLRGIEYVK